MQTQTFNTLHNAIMEAGSKDRPPMLAPDKEVPTFEGSLVTRTERVNETYKNVSQDIKDQLNAEAEAVQIILTGIDNDIYSTIDACPNACEMWKAIKRVEKIARVVNPLALVAQQQPVYHPQHHPTQFTQNSSTRSQQAATRNKGKAIVNSPQPIYDQEPPMNDDDNDLSKERELLASLIEKLECEIDKSNRNKFLETSNKDLIDKLKGEIEDFKNKKKFRIIKQLFKEANNRLTETNNLLYAHYKKSEAKLARCNSKESQLETPKTQFLNEIDRISREYYYADHMNAILGVYTELDEVTNLQCDYLELLEKCERLETELSKSKTMSKSFESVQKHAINLELELQQCKEKINNGMLFKVNKSKDFCKERERYFEIQDLKAQLQDKGIVISVIPTTSVSRPSLKSNPQGDRVMHNNSQGKKQEVEDHRKSVKLSKNKTSVTACNDSLNAKTLNTSNALHNAIMEAGGKDRRPMLAPSKYNPPYEYKWNDKVVPVTEGSSKTTTKRKFTSRDGKSHESYYSRFYKMMNELVRNQCDVTNHKVNVQFLLQLKPEWQRKSTCFIRNLNGNDLLTGSRGTDLYSITLQDTNSPNPICLMAKATSSQAWLWYRRLSQLNFDTINLLSKNDIVVGLPNLKFVKDHLCSSSSINGKRYVLVIVDDYSRYTWTHFLRSKDETPEVLIDFLRLVQRGLEAQVRVVRTEKGTKFLNLTLHAYFAAEGILHQTSVARTPEQNGIVERRNRTLVEAARTMLSAAKVPLFFWAEAIATACFTQNRSLVIPRHDKTPYHIINDRKPSIKFFHIFGFVCYIIRDEENLDKMKEKGDECIFVGYSTQSRAYRVFNKRTRVIMESIHVNFYELPQMASDHISSDPVPECQTMALNHDGLSPTIQRQANVPQADRTVKTSNERDLLFSPMFDELLNGSSKVVSKSSDVSTANAPNQRQQYTTPLNIHTTHAPTCQAPPLAPTIVSSENIHQAETYAENDQVADDKFINIFSTPVQDQWETSSRHVDSSNMHTFYQRYPSEHRCTKDHPLEQVIGKPSQSVRTRRQLESDAKMCMFALTVSRTEPKNIKEAMADSAWIESMQEELHQFDRLDVWELVDRPLCTNVLNLKWL
nr:hypothetical protein [Tanacetum cinerariifolium]